MSELDHLRSQRFTFELDQRYLLLLLGQYVPILGAIDRFKEGLIGAAGFDPELVMRSLEVVAPALSELTDAHGLQAVQVTDDVQVHAFRYPVQTWPAKVKSLALEKLGEVEGELQGIKGQYLILSSGVINLRKYTGHRVRLAAD